MFIQFDPLEYGAVSNKYTGDHLICAEAISSTKIYLTKNAETQEVRFIPQTFKYNTNWIFS